MENASKALIIAGSILLSILIIALGMYIFSTSSSTSDVEILNETEIQTFNAKFEKYKGSQLGSNVDALVSALRSNATTNSKTAERVPTVTVSTELGTSVTGGNLSGDATTYINGLSALKIEKSHRYTIALTYDKNGLITDISISY